MRIAVIGSGKNTKPEIEEKAKEVGRWIARSSCILVTGGCRGYPYAAVQGAKEEKGKTIAISPAGNKEEHVDVYGFPADHSEIVYTGLGIPGRNKEVILNADAVVMIAGEIGTLNEFTLAVYEKKPLGILTGTGGIADIAEQIISACDSYRTKSKIAYSSSPEELVTKILNIIKLGGNKKINAASISHQ